MQWLLNWCESNFQEVINSIIGTAVTLTLGYFALRWRHYSAIRRLVRGDSSDRVVVQLNALETVGGQEVLMLRNLAGSTTVTGLVGADPAAAGIISCLARKTTVKDPLLRFKGPAGEQTLHTVINYVTDANALSPHPLGDLLVAVTCEDRSLVQRTQIRILLIRPADLLRFLDREFCSRLCVEKPWQGVRIVALHQWALDYQREQSEQAPVGYVPLFRTIQIGYRSDFTPLTPAPVDWNAGFPQKALSLSGIGTWVPEPERVP